MTTLITGFGPFGQYSENPSAQVAEAFSAEAVTAVLPVDLDRCVELVRELIDEHRPELVLSIGLAGGTTAVRLERIAVNLIDARIPDISGSQPVDIPVVPGGMAAFFATLPVKAMAAAIREADLPVELSLSAGTYACNAVMYAALEYADRMPEMVRPRCGFVHLPAASELPVAASIRAVRAALAVADGDEISYPAGALS